jgi:release factor glutamine methyltransferase
MVREADTDFSTNWHPTLTAGDMLRKIRGRLTEAGIDSARHEAATLIEHYTGISIGQLYTHPEAPVSREAVASLNQATERREAHEPLAYILGQTGFFGLEFAVGPGVLVPRADTECLVETAIAALDGPLSEREHLLLLDSCTGSGCVGLSIAKHLQAQGRAFKMILVDQEEQALAYARENLKRHQLEEWVQAVQGDLWPSYDASHTLFDLITINPPYIREKDLSGLMPEVSGHEPATALDGGPDGLEYYLRIAQEVQPRLARPGLLLLEHGFDQVEAVSRLLALSGFSDLLQILDYGGRWRVAGGWLKSDA